ADNIVADIRESTSRSDGVDRSIPHEIGTSLGDSNQPLFFGFTQLILHNPTLLMRVDGSNDDRHNTYRSGGPKTKDTTFLPPIFVCILGAGLIVGSVKLLFYSMDRGGNVFYVVFLGGFPIFCFGLLLVFFSFLPETLTIFGFS